MRGSAGRPAGEGEQLVSLVVSDIVSADRDLTERGIPVSEIFHDGPEGQAPGSDPNHVRIIDYAGLLLAIVTSARDSEFADWGGKVTPAVDSLRWGP